MAQKRIQLPSSLSALAKKKTSLAMEAAISTSMSHPNVVHTYHWEMVPIRKSMVSETVAPATLPSAPSHLLSCPTLQCSCHDFCDVHAFPRGIPALL